MVILGIDPGTATTGYGVVKTSPGSRGRRAELAWVAHGTIDTPKGMPAQERLWLLEQGLEKVFRRYKPDLLAVERLYFFKNVKTALPVSEARGIVLLMGAKKGVPLQEFTPPQAKMAV
ncbi:MAG: crossover junction endodeoxyribonuclease RuvC, partial [bacterium]|nr:crossover junction endodeoxyribonuclease RuvC [bacterium]